MDLAYDVACHHPSSSGLSTKGNLISRIISTLLVLLLSSDVILNSIVHRGLGLDDIISLSMVSKDFHSRFDNLAECYLREIDGPDRFLSLGKAFLSLHVPSTSSSVNDMIIDYASRKYPKLDWLASKGDTAVYPTLQSFWQSKLYFGTNFERQVASSFESWAQRHGYDLGRIWFPRETQFNLMVTSPFVQVGSNAIVLATVGKYSDYSFELIRRRLALTTYPFDYHDVVASLGILWYDAKQLLIVLDTFLVSSDEIFWNIILRGSNRANNELLSLFLLKPLVTGDGWTFHHPLGSSPTVYHTNTLIKSHPSFHKTLIKKAKKQGFPKKLVKQLKRKYKFKMK